MEKKIKINPKSALRRFAIAITALNIVGHLFLGFEQSWLYPFVAIFTTYSLQLFFEAFFAFQNNLTPRFKGGLVNLIDFLLPAHISGMAVSMLLFSNESLWPVVFASAVAICSKIIFRIHNNGRSVHFLNPSNTGIAVTLLLFPWVGIAPPYQFTENVFGTMDWVLPVVFIIVGTFLNYKYTKKTTLILAWLVGFLLQAILRRIFFDSTFTTSLIPITGVAFLLFTFYMISDPPTTPKSQLGQIIFGLLTAIVYGLLMIFHVVFGLFFSLIIVCTIRGLYLHLSQTLELRNIEYTMIGNLAVSKTES